MNCKYFPRLFTFLIVVLLLFSFSACIVKKRNYRKGFHVDWVFSKTNTISRQINQGTRTVAERPIDFVQQAEQTMAGAKAEVSPQNNTPVYNFKKPLNIFDENCGDLITLKKGDQIKAKVLEVGVTEIKYKRCDNPDGPLMIVSKSSVYSIKYENGHEDHFFDTPPSAKKNPSDKKNVTGTKPETHPLAVASLVCTILIGTVILWPLASLLGLILGAISAGQISDSPNEYSGYQMAKISAIISGVALVLFVILILALIMTI